MNIAVIAANGRSGKAFVEKALVAGHSVRAGIHQSNTLQTHPRLTVVECDATNEQDVLKLIDGQDAVVSFIGHVKHSPAFVQTDGIKTVIRAMKNLGLRRIVSLTGTGVRFPGDRIGFVDWFLNTGVRFVDPARIKDGKRHVEELQNSELDWTIIRVLKLEDIKPSPFTLTENGPTKWVVSREDVALATLQVLEDKAFIQKAPIISSAK